MRKQAEVIKSTRRLRRKRLTAEESIERMKNVAEWRQQRLGVVRLKKGLEKRLPRVTVGQKESIKRLKHIEEYIDGWIKNHL